MTPIRSATELKDNISKAFRDGLYSTTKDIVPFRFPLDLNLSATTTNIENLYLINCNMHNAIQDVPVALAQIDERGKLQIVCSDDVSSLNSYSYYNMQISHSEKRISDLANKLTQEIQKQEKQTGKYTNIDMQEIVKQSIEKFISEGKLLPSFMHVEKHDESKNSFLTYYMKGEDIKGLCGYTPPDKITIAQSNAVGSKPPCVYVTNDMNNLFDCKSPALINADPLKYAKTLDREFNRQNEVQAGFNEKMKEIFGEKTVGQMSENDKRIYYKAFEKSLKEIITGQESHWLNPNDVTVDKNGTVYYQNNEVGLVNSNMDVSLTSRGLGFLDKCQQPTKQELENLEKIYGDNEPTIPTNQPSNDDFPDR